jgi:hypothetical protein
VLSKRCESAIEIICLASSHDKNLHAKALCGVLNVFRLILRVGICGVNQDCDWRGATPAAAVVSSASMRAPCAITALEAGAPPCCH